MAMKARLQGSARNYQIRGAIWELGSFTYRAYVHIVPTVPRSNLSWREVLGAAKARVNSTLGTSVERLELLPTTALTQDHSTPLRQQPAPRRYPPPTD